MPNETIDVLLVEDNPGDARLLEVFLKDSSVNFTVKHSQRLSDAVEHLSREHPDAVLLDLGLPDSQGLMTLRQARKAAPEVPFVILTGLNDQDLAVQAVREGAQDYLIKGHIASNGLAQSLRYAVERQRLQAETESVRLQQISLKDEFLSHVSHELRSPLNAIYQFVSILNDGLAGDCNPQQREYLQIISRNLAQLQSMIGELLDVTRAGAGKLTVDLQLTPVLPSVEDAVTTVKAGAAAKSVSLSVDVPATLPAAYADPDRLRQVLVNLLENAIKFTPTQGNVTLKSWLVAGEPEMLQFAVSDTGCGIDPEFCDRIFERLYQVHSSDGGRHGLGLGLYICRELVVKQGGQIWVDSSSKGGTTFCFTLPVLSLADILMPILSETQMPVDSLVLLGVEVWTPGGWANDGARREVIARETRYVLSRCILPDVDVLLPKLSFSEQSEFTFIAARTEAKGAQVILKRVNEQLQRNEQLRREGAEWSVDMRMISLAEKQPTTSKSALPKKVADVIRREIDEWTRFHQKSRK